MTKRPTLLAQLIYDKLSKEWGDIPSPVLIDLILKERDRITGERSKHSRGMAPETNWGRRG